MFNLNDDNELDRLSKEAAEDYPLEQQIDSWDKLKVRLDAEMPEERKRRFLLFFLLFLFLGSGAFWISRMNARESGTTRETTMKASSAPEKSKRSSAGGIWLSSTRMNEKNKESTANGAVSSRQHVQDQLDNQKGLVKVETSAQRSATASTESWPVAIANAAEKEAEKSRNRRLKNEAANIAPSNFSKASFAQRNKIRKDQRLTRNKNAANKNRSHSPSIEVAAAGNETNAVSTETQQSESRQPDNLINDSDAIATHKERVDAGQIQKMDSTVSAPLVSNTAIKLHRKKSRWALGLAYAPDLSTVKFTHMQPLGLNLGVTIAYDLNRKISLQTGLFYTTKHYKLNGKDYHPPKGYWTNNIQLDEVQGMCNMWDIPVNIRYNAIIKARGILFFSSGLSSYLMNKENYSYYYYYNGNPVTRSRSYLSNDNYFFSVLNLSAGYERKLNGRFSLMAEPFFKQPLKGIGFGNINLNTSGIYFSMRYRP